MQGFITIGIAVFILILAGVMRVITKTAEENTVFWVCVGVFLVVYVIAVIILSSINQPLPPANVSSFFQENLFLVTP